MLTDPVHKPALREAVRAIASAARIRRLRTMREFAEQEIVLPTGPHQDERFRVSRQPWTGLWFDAIDSGRWRRFNLTGPSQAGKTLQGSALPVMYHLFEHNETVIYAAPTMEMAADKWQQDVLPVIRASRYRDLLPDKGAGSKGGHATAIQFKHGPTLRFMTGGGGDKVRAGFTSRVVVITETDGMDEAGDTSREADKISQLEARTNAFGDRARVYMECTTSTEEGRTWRELKAGTDSRVALPCPHCRKWVTPERDHLVGWQDAANVTDAGERAELVCPDCGTAWTEPQRAEANRLARLAHKGQTIAPDGTVQGMVPRTHTLGFRFTAANNLLVSMARVAEEEWAAPRQTDSALAEKKMRQFYWTQPSEPESITLTELDSTAITKRATDLPRGRAPSDAEYITIGIDVGKWLCHWTAIAWRAGGTPHVIEYGRIEVPSQSMAEEVAILTALRKFKDDVCVVGWPSVVADRPNVRPALVVVDARDWTDTVKAFTQESGPGFLASQGHSVTRISGRWASDPGYDVESHARGGVLPVNADHWKSFVHARIQTPAGQPGGLTLFQGTATDHLSFSKHLTAERRVEEFIAGRGLVTRWERVSRNNHWLDSTAMACVAGHGVGVRLVVPAVAPPAPQPTPVHSQRERPSFLPERPSNWLNR